MAHAIPISKQDHFGTGYSHTHSASLRSNQWDGREGKAHKVLGPPSTLNISYASFRDGMGDSRGPRLSKNNVSPLPAVTFDRVGPQVRKHESIQQDRDHLGVHKPMRSLRGRPSSPLLGQQYQRDGHGSETVGADTRSLRNYGSSSTLRSYYNASSVPLSVSQQTSASSARDLSLRKGLPAIERSESGRLLSKKASMSSMVSEDNNHERHGKQRKRAPRLDLSKFFPKPRAGTTNLLSPRRLTRSPSLSSMYSVEAVDEIPRHRDLVSPKVPDVSAKDPAIEHGQMKNQETPRLKTPGKHNTHSTYLESNSSAGPSCRSSTVWDHQPSSDRAARVNQTGSSDKLRANIHPSKNIDTSLPEGGRRMSVFIDQLHRYQQPKSPLSPPPRNSSLVFRQFPLSIPSEEQSIYSISSRKSSASRASRASTFATSDLQKESVLVLSSEDEDSSSDEKAVEESIAEEDETVDILICDAKSVSAQPAGTANIQMNMASNAKVRTVLGSSGAFPSSQSEVSSANGLLKVPGHESGQRRLRPGKPLEHGHDERPTTSSTASDWADLHPGPPCPAPENPTSIRGRRLMEVTQREMVLLEAMRKRRAMMEQAFPESAKEEWTEPQLSSEKKKESRRTDNKHVAAKRHQRPPLMPTPPPSASPGFKSPTNDFSFFNTTSPTDVSGLAAVRTSQRRVQPSIGIQSASSSQTYLTPLTPPADSSAFSGENSGLFPPPEIRYVDAQGAEATLAKNFSMFRESQDVENLEEADLDHLESYWAEGMWPGAK